MAIPQLTTDQIRTWTLEQKDRWWLENVYRGDMPQLTLRSALTGIALGGILSVLVGAGLGWLIDRWLGISPWGLIVFLLLGFAAGVVNVMRAAGLASQPGDRGA